MISAQVMLMVDVSVNIRHDQPLTYNLFVGFKCDDLGMNKSFSFHDLRVTTLMEFANLLSFKVKFPALEKHILSQLSEVQDKLIKEFSREET